jgi:hypothetical protein
MFGIPQIVLQHVKRAEVAIIGKLRVKCSAIADTFGGHNVLCNSSNT